MNKQTEDKILEMLLHIHEKSIGAHPLDPQMMVFNGGLSERQKEGFYLVKSVLHHCYCQSWRFLALWEGYGMDGVTRDACIFFARWAFELCCCG